MSHQCSNGTERTNGGVGYRMRRLTTGGAAKADAATGEILSDQVSQPPPFCVSSMEELPLISLITKGD
jgi:hypothetical protein